MPATSRADYRGPKSPSAAPSGGRLEPEGTWWHDRILLDADPFNDLAAPNGMDGGAPRTPEWATYLMELALQTVVP